MDAPHETLDFVSATRALREARDSLRDFEGTALAAVAESLAITAETLERTATKLKETQPTEWMSHEECAEYLRKTPDALYKLAASGIIPREKIGGAYLYSRFDVDRAVRRGSNGD